MEAARYDPDAGPVGARRALVERTPIGSAVLDVGAWHGATGTHLMEVRRAVVDGVEPDGDAARAAADRYRRIFICPVEAALDELEAQGPCYDVILLLDVLEHLVDPAGVLWRLRALLRPEGRALISIPNVAHWSVRRALLLGRWDYRNSGILDRTHLRFYTFASSQALLEAAGWRITFRAASLDQPPRIRLARPLLGHLGRWPGLFGVQALYEAVDAAPDAHRSRL